MNSYSDWWKAWSPFWDIVEDRYFSSFSTSSMLKDIRSPVLIIGAGQGLIVEFLANKGYSVTGVDREDCMIEMAKKRRGIDLVKADALNLPFKDSSFATVLIASGVLDFCDDSQVIRDILNEACRVTHHHGKIHSFFYRIPEKLEKVYRNLGVITRDNIYHMNRIFEIEEISKKDPLTIVGFGLTIKKWSGRNLLLSILSWMRMGIKLPKELVEERNNKYKIDDKAAADNLDADLINEVVPHSIPYRLYEDIFLLFKNLGFVINNKAFFPDCTVVTLTKTNFCNSGNVTPREEISDWILKSDNITKRYSKSKSNAVNHISCTIPRNLIFGILGPNGAGKTTFLSMICGLISPTSGSFFYKNNVTPSLGIVPQELSLYQGLTAYENCRFFGASYGIKKDELKKRIATLLEFTGLTERQHTLVRTFSSGMKRRLNLAIGLLHNPDILLLDEPTVGIDPQSRNYIFKLLFQLKDQGKTIIYTTHYMEEAHKLCDRIMIIDHGSVLVEGIPDLLVTEYGIFEISYKIQKKLPDSFTKYLVKESLIDSYSVKDSILKINSVSINDAFTLVEKIAKNASQHDTKILLMDIVKPSLERLFLDITGHSLRDMSSSTQEEFKEL